MSGCRIPTGAKIGPNPIRSLIAPLKDFEQLDLDILSAHSQDAADSLDDVAVEGSSLSPRSKVILARALSIATRRFDEAS